VDASDEPEDLLDVPALIALVAGALSLPVGAMAAVHTMLVAGLLVVLAWFFGVVVLLERPAPRHRWAAWAGVASATVTAAVMGSVYFSAG
jgi:hypothetical protein